MRVRAILFAACLLPAACTWRPRQTAAKAPATAPKPATPAPPPELSTLQRSLWDMLTAEPKHVDALVAAAGAETGQVLTALTELELKGLVKQQAGMRFGLA